METWKSKARSLLKPDTDLELSLAVFPILIGTIFFYLSSVYTVEINSLSKLLISSKIAFLGIVISVSLVSIQLVSSSFNPHLSKLIQKNQYLEKISAVFLASIFLDLVFLLSNLGGHESLALFIMGYSLSFSFMYFVYIQRELISLTRPERILEILNNQVDYEYYKKKRNRSVESDKFDDRTYIEEIVDIVNSSVERGDTFTAIKGLESLQDLSLRIMRQYFEKEEVFGETKRELPDHIDHHHRGENMEVVSTYSDDRIILAWETLAEIISSEGTPEEKERFSEAITDIGKTAIENEDHILARWSVNLLLQFQWKVQFNGSLVPRYSSPMNKLVNASIEHPWTKYKENGSYSFLSTISSRINGFITYYANTQEGALYEGYRVSEGPFNLGEIREENYSGVHDIVWNILVLLLIEEDETYSTSVAAVKFDSDLDEESSRLNCSEYVVESVLEDWLDIMEVDVLYELDLHALTSTLVILDNPLGSSQIRDKIFRRLIQIFVLDGPFSLEKITGYERGYQREKIVIEEFLDNNIESNSEIEDPDVKKRIEELREYIDQENEG